ncbi:two-component sensor histidine kinase [Pseudoduganella sp. DS3]|uniref:histidine kinase n=1 Tax=Pseudoduganella guangdongensis TaxID=2692179 RepID=A0A6N9HKU7_9BURK|nr:HAMP domain-containing sensor histidine kinase [Pseudoduganella guangdongensis]MYN03867.1 two-component sensor histidine kinase [Pseudoduganella guangdongensis]
MTGAAPAVSPHLYTAYESDLRAYRLRFSRGGAWTGIALVLLGVGLDYSLYPAHLGEFALARVLVSLGILAIIGIMRQPWGQRHVEALSFTWLMLPQAMIAWMIAVTEGAQSIYYAGLNLAVFASAIAFAFRMWQNLALGLLTYLLYAAACYSHAGQAAMDSAFAVNSLLLAFSATASAVCTYYNEQARFNLFQLKAELADKNRQLEANNRSLAEIKGQMLQQEKMAALGTLAAGLLHEVNNPVNFCMMAIDVAMEEPAAKGSEVLKECLVDAKQGMQRVQYIVSDLKTFAYRKSGSEHESAQFLFERALESSVRLVGHEIKGVKVQRHLQPDTLVRGDEAAIIGVLINLLSNAALAMRKGATTAPTIDIYAEARGERLKITVRDNGPGIARENIGRVFEPFFTTREVGQGLGLGLSICYSVIQRHGGLLAVESVPGEWTQFTFDLPRVTGGEK